MSTAGTVASTSEAKKAPRTSAWKDLLGLVPYLGRYKGAIALGLLTLALMGIVGSLIPLATGIITDTLAGSPQPFARVSGGSAALGGASWLNRMIPFYAPNSRHTLGIYCLILILCVLLKGYFCLLYTSPSPRDLSTSRMPSSA